jgi:hypothetical protein
MLALTNRSTSSSTVPVLGTPRSPADRPVPSWSAPGVAPELAGRSWRAAAVLPAWPGVPAPGRHPAPARPARWPVPWPDGAGSTTEPPTAPVTARPTLFVRSPATPTGR